MIQTPFHVKQTPLESDMAAPMIKPSRRGLLHKKLGVPQGEKIPEGKIQKAKQSSSPALRKEATFAENFGGKSKGGGSRGTIPKGEHYAPNHREPRNADEFHALGNAGKK
jgi:hypothetical protein